MHFHEDPAGLFADVRLGPGDFTRMRVSTKAEQRSFMTAVRTVLALRPHEQTVRGVSR